MDDMAARAPNRPPESSPESSSESGDDAMPPIAPPTDAACDPADVEADDGDGPGKLPKLSARKRPPGATAGRRWRRWWSGVAVAELGIRPAPGLCLSALLEPPSTVKLLVYGWYRAVAAAPDVPLCRCPIRRTVTEFTGEQNKTDRYSVSRLVKWSQKHPDDSFPLFTNTRLHLVDTGTEV